MSIIAVSSLVLVAYEPYFVVFILSLLCHLYRVLAHLYDEETVGGQRDAEVVAGRAVGKELAATGGKHGYGLGSGVHNAQDAVFNPCAGTVVGTGLAEACGLGGEVGSVFACRQVDGVGLVVCAIDKVVKVLRQYGRNFINIGI